MTSKPKVEQYGDRAVSGFMWFFSQTVLVRLVNYASQIILAWILAPNAFGLIGIAYSIQTFATILQNNGISQILIAKKDDYWKLSNAGFWLSSIFGLLTFLLMLVIAPVAANFYGNEKLSGLVIILGASILFTSLRPVMFARLSIDLDFKTISILQGIEMVGQKVLTIILALIGYGVYSFVLPTLLIAPIITVYLFVLVKPNIKMSPEFSLWPGLLSLSSLILLSSVFSKIMQQGDYLILGAFFSERQVGIYYMAYALSVQPIMLLGTNLRTLLIPIISKLNEQTSRKEGAYFRTTKVILFFTFLFSGFLFVNAEPLINLIFSEKWYDVIPLLQILALGMAFRPIMIASEAYIEGEGKFHLKAITTIIISLIFLAATISIGRISVISFSIIVGFVFLSGSILFFFSAIGMKRETLSKLKDLALKPLTIVSGTSIVNIIAYRISDGHNYSEIFSLTLGLIIFMSIPFVIVKCLDENLWADMKMILNKLSKKMSNNAAAA